jgi:hypothetical protein
MAADGWTGELTSHFDRKRTIYWQFWLSASQDPISLVELGDGHFYRKFNANWSES